jgi:hypothetical protein
MIAAHRRAVHHQRMRLEDRPDDLGREPVMIVHAQQQGRLLAEEGIQPGLVFRVAIHSGVLVEYRHRFTEEPERLEALLHGFVGEPAEPVEHALRIETPVGQV